MAESDTRRCYAHTDCEGGEDEDDCPIFIKPGIHICIGLAILVTVLSVPVCLLIQKYNLLCNDTESQIKESSLELKYLAMTNLADLLVGIVLRGKEEWDSYESEYMRSCYKSLHRISGGVRMFLHVMMTLIDKWLLL